MKTTHNKPSITLHTYIQNYIKNKHLPQFISLLGQTHLQRTMSTWGQSEKSIFACIHHIITIKTQAPGSPTLLTLNPSPNLESSTCLNKKSCSSKNFKHLDSLPSNLLHNINMWHSGLLHQNIMKPVLAQLTHHNPVLRASKSYELKYSPL